MGNVRSASPRCLFSDPADRGFERRRTGCVDVSPRCAVGAREPRLGSRRLSYGWYLGGFCRRCVGEVGGQPRPGARGDGFLAYRPRPSGHFQHASGSRPNDYRGQTARPSSAFGTPVCSPGTSRWTRYRHGVGGCVALGDLSNGSTECAPFGDSQRSLASATLDSCGRCGHRERHRLRARCVRGHRGRCGRGVVCGSGRVSTQGTRRPRVHRWCSVIVNPRGACGRAVARRCCGVVGADTGGSPPGSYRGAATSGQRGSSARSSGHSSADHRTR